jgi:hypothetical protein
MFKQTGIFGGTNSCEYCKRQAKTGYAVKSLYEEAAQKLGVKRWENQIPQIMEEKKRFCQLTDIKCGGRESCNTFRI